MSLSCLSIDWDVRGILVGESGSVVVGVSGHDELRGDVGGSSDGVVFDVLGR